MQTSPLGRVLGTLLLAAQVSCSGTSGNPYASIGNPPLLQARLHTVTLATDGPEVAEALQVKGYAPAQFTSNYPASNAVEASLWSVPLAAVENVTYYKAPAAGADVRVLKMALAARAAPADAAVEKAFFRNVLGSDVPQVPADVDRAANARVQAWTYVIPNVRDASKRLREGGIPVVFDPVAITTAYLGDHKAMAIRAPDGTIVELVETAAQ
ncbi:MAG TPA: hypothetical protein VFS58_03355 [Steroidobacteraceae bacterium]|nr:hypothetical protein [Steroidobacteraceae bacterium]